MKTNDLRKKYLEFFKSKSHRIIASDSLVPDDASILFTPAGMNQFKPYFLGQKKDISRATTCQKCLRTGDLENVGKTAYHHTFFEMLGNFSFGDYFKKETIEFAWEFITGVLNLKEKDLWVSVYKDDKEAYSIWVDHIGIPKEKIIKLGEKSNYWPAFAPSQGPNGPCGPCSEIFFDQGKNVGCRSKKCNPDCSCGRFVEFWNLVFTQFNRVKKNKLEPLPQKNIDTGMGLERMACVLQGKSSNFEIDILAPAVEEVKNILKADIKQLSVKSLVYAIVDHARAATFAIADGVYPSNEARGYVIRKIIRKALWSADLLGRKTPFLYKMVDLYGQLSENAYPSDAYSEIRQKRDIIVKVIKTEEEKFLATLKEGKQRIMVSIEGSKKGKKSLLAVQDVFQLYDTYGFPLELSRQIAKEHNLKVDEKGFVKLLQKQQELSRKKSMFDESIFKKGELNLTEKTEFVGYELTEAPVNIRRILSGDEILLVLDKTPFYPEAGGQLSDKGIIKTKEAEFQVEGVFKVNQAIVHKGKVMKGKITKGAATAIVDNKRRKALARAHTTTHLLQAALRKVLGNHVIQQGSLVNEDEFRFDFTHFSKLNSDEFEKVEELVRSYIFSADKVEKKEVGFKEAKKQGALAFFKDKYQDKVRVVSISNYSKELCGGIHVDNTSEIKRFTILKESSISSGIRRIKAVVGEKVDNEILRIPAAKIKKSAEKGIEKAKINQAVDQGRKKIMSEASEAIQGISLLYDFTKVDASSTKEQREIMRKLSDVLKQKIKPVFIFLVRNVEAKDIFICSVTDDLVNKGLNCRKFLTAFGEKLSLTGGGSDKMAQGSIANRGADFSKKLKEAFAEFIRP